MKKDVAVLLDIHDAKGVREFMENGKRYYCQRFEFSFSDGFTFLGTRNELDEFLNPPFAKTLSRFSPSRKSKV